jgi:hypothetical protein
MRLYHALHTRVTTGASPLLNTPLLRELQFEVMCMQRCECSGCRILVV